MVKMLCVLALYYKTLLSYLPNYMQGQVIFHEKTILLEGSLFGQNSRENLWMKNSLYIQILNDVSLFIVSVLMNISHVAHTIILKVIFQYSTT